MYVLLIDEEVVIRAGIRVLIDSWPNSQVVGEVDNLRQALEVIGKVKPDVIVCSHAEGSRGFFDGLRELVQAPGETPVILLTGSQDPQIGALAVAAGAKWIVLKKHAAVELQRALEGVRSGKEWGAEFAAETRVAQMYRRSGKNDKSWFDTGQSLTAREREVAELVGQGCTNRQSGKRLGITEITVRHHLTSIFNKLQ